MNNKKTITIWFLIGFFSFSTITDRIPTGAAFVFATFVSMAWFSYLGMKNRDSNSRISSTYFTMAIVCLLLFLCSCIVSVFVDDFSTSIDRISISIIGIVYILTVVLGGSRLKQLQRLYDNNAGR